MYVLHRRKQTALPPQTCNRQRVLEILPSILTRDAQDFPNNDLLPHLTSPGVRCHRTETRRSARLEPCKHHGLHHRLHVRPTERVQPDARRICQNRISRHLSKTAPLPFLVQRAAGLEICIEQIGPHHRAQIRARSHQLYRKLDSHFYKSS